MTVLLGDLEIAFGADTRFWLGDDQVSRSAFADEVRGRLASGQMAPVVAERGARLSPQDPEDGRFVARDVALEGDGTPSLRVKVGRRNLEVVPNASGDQPDGWLRVFGHRMRLRMRDGTTRAECHRRLEEFSGQIASVNLDARTFTLADGPTVRVSRRTSFVRGEDHVRSLRAVAEALEAGSHVLARGHGAVERRDGRLLALRVALEVEEAVEEEPVLMEFEGVVAGVQQSPSATETTLLLLADGTSVQVGSATDILGADDVSPGSLAQLVEALEAGREVRAWGSGHVMGEDPLVLEGLRVVLQSDAPEDGLDEFAGTVYYVSDGGAVILIDGTAVLVTDETEVLAADARSPASLEELLAMLDLGRRIDASGVGRFETEENVVAVRLVLAAQVEDFDLDVVAIDPYSGGLFLEDDSFVLLTEGTVVTAVGDGPTDLVGVDEALYNGDRVRVRGSGYLIGANPVPGEPLSLEALEVEFERIPQG